VEDKTALRKLLRSRRSEHVSDLPGTMRALMFKCPPSPVAARVADGLTVGLYWAGQSEAPTLAYAKWFHERGHLLALPCFADRDDDMHFRTWHDPYDAEELDTGPFSIPQPATNSAEALPDVVFVPLVGFTERGDRIGQGAGHYDRWLEANPNVLTIGLAWDCQLVDDLPVEPHDQPLDMVVTPTQIYERSN